MISSVSSSISAIQAARTLQDVSANNVANGSTDGFKEDTASVAENDAGGVSVTLGKNSEPGPLYQKPGGNVAEAELIEASNVNLAREMTSQIINKNYNSANIAALKTSDEMQKSIIDIIA